MKITSIAFGLGLLLAVSLFGPSPARAQKIIHITGTSAKVTLTPVRVRKFRRVIHARRIRGKSLKKTGLAHIRFFSFGLPEQTLFPPFYRSPQPYAQGPDMTSRLVGGKTAKRGSLWRGRIEGGKTVERGAPRRSRLKGGRTVKGGSRWASRIVAGSTVERGSPFASTMPNWRFSGYAAPMRPKGIAYYRAKRRKRSPWASRLR